MSNDIPRPLAALRAWSRERPNIWRGVDTQRQARKPDNTTWPSYVYLTLPAAGQVATKSMVDRGLLRSQPRGGEVVREAMELACYASWRIGQGIYRYDQTLYAALIDTPITGDLPAETLIRLPEWCVYLETPGLTVPSTQGDAQLLGCYAWLDYDPQKARDILTLGLDAEDCQLAIQHVPLTGTLEESMAEVIHDWQASLESGATKQPIPEEYARLARQTLPPILSLLLYLCADDADVGDGETGPAKPQPKRTKDGWRLFPADQPKQWNVGLRLGAALRRALEATERADDAGEGDGSGEAKARVRAHLRRAHWHTFRAGTGRTDRRVKWLPPIPVNVDTREELPAVLRKVE